MKKVKKTMERDWNPREKKEKLEEENGWKRMEQEKNLKKIK